MNFTEDSSTKEVNAKILLYLCHNNSSLAKERHVLKGQIETLQRKRDANEITLKDFLKEKNYMKDKLAYYNIILRGTGYQAD